MKIILSLALLMSIMSMTKLTGQNVIEILSKTKGMSGGVNVGYISYSSAQLHQHTESGIGFGGFFQYGFSHKISASLSYQHFFITSLDEEDRVDNSPYPFDDINLIAKYIFGSTNTNLRPYVALGGTYTKSQENYEYLPGVISYQSFSGFGFCAGGGLSYFVTPQLSADLSFLYHAGNYNTNYVDGVRSQFLFEFFNIQGLGGITYHF